MTLANVNKVPVRWAPLLPGGKCTDIAVYFDGKLVQADVTVTSKVDNNALPAARRVKLRKYEELCRAQGDTFITLGFATSGAWLPEVDFWVKRVAAAGKENMAARALSTREMRDRLAVTLQVGNALVQLEALASLRSKGPEWLARRQRRGRIVPLDDVA